MVFLTKHEESIKAIPRFAFEETYKTYLQSLQTTFPHNLLQPLNLFELLLLLPLSKAFKSFLVFQTLKTKVCYSSFSFPSPFAKKNSPRTNRLNSFCVSLLPFPKEQRTNRLNSFCVSLLPCQRIQNNTV